MACVESRTPAPTRRSPRAAWLAYREGTYFVTLCVFRHACRLGLVIDDVFIPGPFGQSVYRVWQTLHAARSPLWQVMPNHLHAILRVNPQTPSLPASIARFKVALSKELRGEGLDLRWQRSFYDHLIRDWEGEEGCNIRHYIRTNPAHWRKDCLYADPF